MCETSSRYIDDGAARGERVRGREGGVERELKGMRSTNEENGRRTRERERRKRNGLSEGRSGTEQRNRNPTLDGSQHETHGM